MCQNGHTALGLATDELDFHPVDFVQFARSLGANGISVADEGDLDNALSQALVADGPFVVDVKIDPGEPSPLAKRFESLIKQGASKHAGGWNK